MSRMTSFAIGAMLLATPVQSEIANINGADLFYTTIGQGVPVMVMHGGLGLDHTYLRPYFDALQDQAQVIYYDHLGNGRSERPADFADLTFERFVADAEALRLHLGLGRIILIGHSYGGFIAQEYAAAYPDNLLGLVLANTVPVFDYAPALAGTEQQMAALGEVFSRPMRDDEDFRTIWNLISQMYYKDYDPAIGAELDRNTRYSHAAWNAASGLLAGFDTTGKLASVTVPTLVIGGRHDGITPVEPGAERIDGLLPDSKIVVFENSGHFPFIEQQAMFFDTLGAWIAGIK